MCDYEYVTEELANNTKYKSVFDAYNRGDFSAILYGKKLMHIYDTGLAPRTYKLVVKECKRLYPSIVGFFAE